MARKIIMLHNEWCLAADVMKPFVLGMGISKGKYEFELYTKQSKEGEKMMKKHKKLLEEFDEIASPIFIDEEKEKAVHALDAETLMEFLEGKEWWK